MSNSDKIVELANEGYSYKDIASEIGVSPATVQRRFKEASPNRHKKHACKIGPEHVDDIRFLINHNCTKVGLARQYNVTLPTINSYLIKYAITTRN